ncbi:MAG TPA: THUMP domain-containing protein, partial [Nevskiaceae bacterium]|nr:THUMP domain-containing protein [Nevskiaceae bacterium]
MSTLQLFATCPRGVENLLAAELAALGAISAKERKGGVAFGGELAVAYRACLWSRVASRVLLPLSTFPLTDADALYAGARAIDWTAVFGAQATFAIEVAGNSPALTHTHYAGLKVKDAIADVFREKTGARPDVDTERPDIRVHLHLERAQATLSLDFAGDSLHRRGYRMRGGEAPLKENLAAAILLRAGWPALAREGAALLDPMCGSGTLVIEAALMAADIAPNLARARFGFESWLGHDDALWREVRADAQSRRSAGLARALPPMRGADRDAQALKLARASAERAGFTTQIEWSEGD